MALLDRPVVRQMVEAAENRIGVTIAPTREVRRLRTVEQEFTDFAAEADELAFHSLDYFNGRPTQLSRERRRRLAQRSRIALLEDPLAGAEAQLVADFAFGKGIGKPSARNPAVQDVVDAAWTDPVNEQVLTGYPAQRKLSNELITSGELWPTLYVKGGSVRVGRLDADLVVDVVPDPENRLVPLWAVVRQRRYEWNFQMDQPKFTDNVVGDYLQVKYYEYWRNVEIAKKDRETEDTSDEAPLEEPPPEKLAKGLVYPLLINQTGEDLRGNPPWARSLRFMAAMNVLTEAHVTMAQAASTFIARRGLRGTPRQILKAATSITTMASELGSGLLRPNLPGVSGNAEPSTEPFTPPGTPGPFPPGSWWQEHMDNSKLEALSLNSGAGQMAQTAQIVRAPVAASSGFGQHYLGDTCHDVETETLTEDGWLGFDELRSRALAGTLPQVAAYDIGTERLRYEKPIRFCEGAFDGEMVAFEGRAQDVLVTPNHRMVVARVGRGGMRVDSETTEVRLAEDVERGRWAVRAAAELEGGEERRVFVLPAFRKRYAPNRGSFPRREELHERIRRQRAAGATWQQIREAEGCGLPTISRALGLTFDRRSEDVIEPERELRMDDWLAFLGWWIAEGSAGEGGAVRLAQSLESPFLSSLQETCARSGFVGTHRERPAKGTHAASWSWTAGSVQLASWLRAEAGCCSHEKRIPGFVWGLPRRQKMILLRALMYGDGQCDSDGRWEREGQSVYGTTSRRLADDVQRLGLECGFRALLSEWPTAVGRRQQWRVGLVAPGGRNGRGERDNRCVSLGRARRVAYRGSVYCLTMPSGTLVTRRNGRVAFHGNSDTNLATAATLELPATMHVGAWQEYFEGLYRWFTDRAIEAAVRAGRLGGAQGYLGEKPLAEMCLSEAEDRAVMEERTGKDLSYEFSMPFPGRRQLADVVTVVQQVSASQDPNGVNIPLRRLLLRFLFEQIGIDDVSRAVEECIPLKPVPGGIGPQPDGAPGAPGAFGGAAPPGAPAGTGAGQGAGANDPGEGQQPYGAKSGTASGGGSAGADGSLEGLDWLTEADREALGSIDAAADRMFRTMVEDPAVAAAAGAGANGSH